VDCAQLELLQRKQLFIPEERWAIEARRHYTRLSLPPTARQFLAPVLNRLTSGLQAVAAAANSGKLSIDDDLHLKALEAEDEDTQVVKLRAALNERVGEAQLTDCSAEALMVSFASEVVVTTRTAVGHKKTLCHNGLRQTTAVPSG
jgi:hypothetical protein